MSDLSNLDSLEGEVSSENLFTEDELLLALIADGQHVANGTNFKTCGKPEVKNLPAGNLLESQSGENHGRDIASMDHIGMGHGLREETENTGDGDAGCSTGDTDAGDNSDSNGFSASYFQDSDDDYDPIDDYEPISNFDDVIETSSSQNLNRPITPVLTNESSANVFCGDLGAGRKRKIKADPSTWFLTENRRKRMRGESYLAYQSTNGKLRKVERQQKSMEPGCTSKRCHKMKNRYCHRFSEEDRIQIFNEYWKLMDWKQKRAYVISLVDRHETVRKSTKGPSRRSESFVYYLKLNGQKRLVCRNMFLKTLGIGDNQMRDWVINKKFTPSTKLKGQAKEEDTNRASAKQFLSDLPKVPSHYCRSKSSKLYLEPPFSSYADIYRVYKSYCAQKLLKPLCRKTLISVVQEMNISIYVPRKDQCDYCCSYKAGNVSTEDYNNHIQLKTAAQKEKTMDKESAIYGNCHALTMDLQAVKVSPLLNASALYYKTKLIVHNFTVYDLVTSDAKCYLWDESEGGLVASVFATCVLDFLSRFTDDKPIIIYSDGCAYQNRNAILSSALLELAVKTGKTIMQKYLEKGHTMMEVDSVHSSIERKLKGNFIHLPTDYIDYCNDARIRPRPYEVQYMRHGDFFDYSEKSTQRYSSIKPSDFTGGACVTDIRQLRYNPNGLIEFKLSHTDEMWIPLPRNPRANLNDISPLYTERCPIAKRKYNDLQELLNVIPDHCHDFYKSLPYK